MYWKWLFVVCWIKLPTQQNQPQSVDENVIRGKVVIYEDFLNLENGLISIWFTKILTRVCVVLYQTYGGIRRIIFHGWA